MKLASVSVKVIEPVESVRLTVPEVALLIDCKFSVEGLESVMVTLPAKFEKFPDNAVAKSDDDPLKPKSSEPKVIEPDVA